MNIRNYYSIINKRIKRRGWVRFNQKHHPHQLNVYQTQLETVITLTKIFLLEVINKLFPKRFCHLQEVTTQYRVQMQLKQNFKAADVINGKIENGNLAFDHQDILKDALTYLTEKQLHQL